LILSSEAAFVTILRFCRLPLPLRNTYAKADADALPNVPRDAAPDMPDRIIAATALHLGLPLVTRDRRLQAAGIQTIW
jgi:predicted nucleic acid-binding protein